MRLSLEPATTGLRRSSDWSQDDAWETTTNLVVALAVVLAGFDLRLTGGISATLLIIVVTVPMWWQAIGQFSFARAILVVTTLALVAGLYLAEMTSFDHVLDRTGQRGSILVVLGGSAAMVATLWGRTRFPLHHLAVLYAAGALADAGINSERSWKFNLAVPTTILLVGYLGRFPSRLPAVVVLIGAGLAGIADEARSFFAFCVLAACLVLWESRPADETSRTWRWTPAIILAGAAAAVYGIATSLLAGGYFGADVQQRTVAQIDTTGSVIAGGRPEWAASRALLTERPWGYGVGIVPDAVDYNIAKSGLDSINVNTGGYLTNYMLGGQFRLHSVTADLWVSYGWVGVALAALIVFALARSMSTLLAERTCAPVVAFAAVLALWHMAFGPIFSNWPDVCFALGLSLLARREREQPEANHATGMSRARATSRQTRATHRSPSSGR